MKVLVTGGAGFIGSHVCDEFLRGGHDVIALDDLSGGKRENLDPRVRLAVHDIRSREASELIKSEKPDVLCHLAAQMDVRRSVDDPSFDADVNIRGMLNLLEAARVSGVKKVIFSSTGGAIYGEQDVFPAPESHPTRPISPYGVSKASGELYLGYYRAQYGLPYVALRYANVYGPRQNPHGEAGVVAIFSQRLIAGQGCTIFGEGKQTRDFVFGPDVARANRLAFENDYVGAINIGTGVETDINRLYALLAEAAGSSVSVAHAPGKPGEQMRSCVDNALARKVLGWEPSVDVREGLRRTLEYFRQKAGAPARAHG
ncbi:UDP-glucose 4-epimerase [Myxococcus xanthus DK 1622]|uniref:UDP-glucose 4-epimerase n=1 Tax=Myxococcus xanthus (strain DK1622) TaxID=246197 RepID=Q1D6M2_MYXXD|nr:MULTISPECIES: NAD-dependent epimerase/dehydratase family protein [Myxococcus]ABF89692.1 UDP-glucose 4-epimerase [Myxococcus xanthus DK 1622]NOJ51976.1 NAD-dependent epimerase/dehydratase family protein [Myxococcus xanthus]QDE90414.1 UDP-glucose 4-epimerase [Myxococcus xanthus]QPM82924.1 NAD-dependent epimerase/dehydratase family protein [Myxococcus xanthus]QQR47808.1 NAD-dependent epimerase/dehydratase family protein [Myxococcus xanthus]